MLCINISVNALYVGQTRRHIHTRILEHTRDEKLRLRTRKMYSKGVAMLKFAKFAQLCTALNLKIDNSFTLLHSYHCRRGNT